MSNIINIHGNLTSKLTVEEDLLAIGKQFGIEEAIIKIDPSTHLHAIIVIHSTKLGPALGGCRCIAYPSIQDAFVDAVRLAKGMSYKAAIMGLPYGGGKSVLLKPEFIPDRDTYFKSFGRIIDELGGRYITAVDVGTSTLDMDVIASQTNFVTSTSGKNGVQGDPAPYTALGVLRGIQAAVMHKYQRSHLAGLRILIQGVGHVGYQLAKLLTLNGAKVYISDINQNSIEKCRAELQCEVVRPEVIYSAECDVFAPCALGGVINNNTINLLRCAIVAGSANNQLLENHYAEILHEKGILYAPDYIISGGGLIKVVSDDQNVILKKINLIYDLLLDLFDRSSRLNISPVTIADQTVDQILYADSHSEAVYSAGGYIK